MQKLICITIDRTVDALARLTRGWPLGERNRSTLFRVGPKSGTLKGCVQTGTLQTEQFRSKKWNDQKSDSELANGKHVNGTIAFPSEHKAILVRNRSVPV